jgi:hypothetical protein
VVAHVVWDAGSRVVHDQPHEAFVVLLDQPWSPAAQPATRAETSAITTTKRIASNDPCARSEA